MTQPYNNKFERELDWNDTIQNDAPDFVVLEPGEYWFTVEGFDRARHNGSEKVPPCNKAIVKLRIDTNQGTAYLTHNLLLHSNTEGILSAFFGAIGQKKHGAPLQMNWQHVPGAVGVCKVKNHVYNGNTYNDVQSMIYSEDVDPTKQLNLRPGTPQPTYQAPVQQYAQPVQAPQPQMQQQPQTGWQPGAF